MPVPLIKGATNLIRRKKYSQAIAVLESKVFHYRNSFQYYYLLGLACLHTGDLNGANSYLNRAQQLNANNVSCRLAVAALNLMRSNVDESLAVWLEIIERDKGNRTARQALGLLKKGYQPLDIYENRRRREAIIPPLPWKPPVAAIAVSLAAVSVIVLGGIFIPRLLRPNTISRIEKEGLDLSIGEDSVGSQPGEYFYTLTSREIQRSLDAAKRYFNDYRDNLALVEINRLLLSGASDEVKNIAHLLKDYIQIPDFSNFRDNFTLKQIRESPPLYHGCFVVWKGKIANLVVTDEQMRFILLVGYHEERTFEDDVPVTLDFAADIDSGDNLELLARLTIEDDILTLEGVSIHEIE